MSDSPSPSLVGTQEERDIDTRLSNSIRDSSSLIEEAMKQLAKPCIAPKDEHTEDEDYVPPTPIDIAITKSNRLLEEARLQLGSPKGTSLCLTEEELAENKATAAWLQTYRSIESTNEVRSGASQDFLGTILRDIDEEEDEDEDENGEFLTTSLSAPPRRMNESFVQSAKAARDERRAKRASRVCSGPRVAAVVAKINAIDDEVASTEPHRHVRNTSVRSFGK